MIAIIDQVASGGALQLVMQPRTGSTATRITRSVDVDDLVDENGGTLVYEGRCLSLLDGPGLVNGVTYWYRAWYRFGATWVGTPAVSQTPVASFADYSVNPQNLLRDRLQEGFKEIVRRTAANDDRRGPRLNPKSGSVPVLFGTPAYENATFPLVVLHVSGDRDQQRAIGETVQVDDPGIEYEGWLSGWSIEIQGMSLNYDERKALRESIKTIVIANLPILDAAGLTLPSLSLTDVDDMESFPAPVYMVSGTFTCMAPSIVSDDRPVIEDVSVNVSTPLEA